MTKLVGSGLRGRIEVVSDKSITHRGVLFGALSSGKTVLERPNPGADCRATLAAAATLGARVHEEPERWTIEGGTSLLREPEQVLDLGNSGTGMRLLTGLLAGIDGISVLTGDDSLRRRPMRRVIDPLALLGVRIDARQGGKAPLVVHGGSLRVAPQVIPVASAQVKSALLLAGTWFREGALELDEPVPSRDHTERLLQFLGATCERRGARIRLVAPVELSARSFRVPGDPSAAAFFAVAATIVPGSHIRIENVGTNPTRTGALAVLSRMGAKLSVHENTVLAGPEPMGTIEVESAELVGTEVHGSEIPTLVDEIPVLAVAAAMARGETVFHDIAELRVKESDRIRTTAEMLRALGAFVDEGPDWMRVVGTGSLHGGRVATERDHRIAMSARVASLVAEGSVEIDDVEMVATSDPGFFDTLAFLIRGGEAQ